MSAIKFPDYKGNKGGKKGSTLNLQQLPLRPEESIKHMVVPKGLKVELVAADPDIYRPICMNWDEQGRLWIAETTGLSAQRPTVRLRQGQ